MPSRSPSSIINHQSPITNHQSTHHNGMGRPCDVSFVVLGNSPMLDGGLRGKARFTHPTENA
jgi:hypothetical protein